MLRLGHYPSQWKVAQFILIPKQGKHPTDVGSYRPISLLPIISKVFEKLFLQSLKPLLEEKKLIPEHQFGFRAQHSTMEQAHRVVTKIRHDLERRYCSVAFIDISLAFDKVWHPGLLYKIKGALPHTYYPILQSYLTHRLFFFAKYQDATTCLNSIVSGVPQGSILGPVLYLLYTSDLPKSVNTVLATYTSNKNPNVVSKNLQKHLNSIQNWLKAWLIKANPTKSVHVTFTLNKTTCPLGILNSDIIPQKQDAKYLGLDIDRRLTWRKYIWSKRKPSNSNWS